MNPIGTLLYTTLFGQSVGQDEFGNRYFQERKVVQGRRRKRWVVYKGLAEASKVPARWHRWLHYTTDKTPKDNNATYAWEKPHLPNLTGTQHAYVPEGHIRKGGRRYKVAADYEAWVPGQAVPHSSSSGA
jgi:NADH:ubiquinone oxidoreductase subunit